jgi:hypothetical protein
MGVAQAGDAGAGRQATKSERGIEKEEVKTAVLIGTLTAKRALHPW